MKTNLKYVYFAPDMEVFILPAETFCEVSTPVTIGDYPGLGDEQNI